MNNTGKFQMESDVPQDRTCLITPYPCSRSVRYRRRGNPPKEETIRGSRRNYSLTTCCRSAGDKRSSRLSCWLGGGPCSRTVSRMPPAQPCARVPYPACSTAHTGEQIGVAGTLKIARIRSSTQISNQEAHGLKVLRNTLKAADSLVGATRAAIPRGEGRSNPTVEYEKPSGSQRA
jgi:hypothetical protein